MANFNPFTVAKSHFANTKFYFGPTPIEEVQLTYGLPKQKGNKSKGAEKQKSQKITHALIPEKEVANENKIKESCFNKPPCKAYILCYVPVTK